MVWTGNWVFVHAKGPETRDKGNCVVFKVDANRFTRGIAVVEFSSYIFLGPATSLPAVLQPPSRPQHLIPLQTGRERKDIGSTREICLRTASWVAGVSPVRVVFPYISFRAFSLIIYGLMRCVASFFITLWRELPGSLGSPLLAIQIFIAISGCILCTILVNLSLDILALSYSLLALCCIVSHV